MTWNYALKIPACDCLYVPLHCSTVDLFSELPHNPVKYQDVHNVDPEHLCQSAVERTVGV